MFRKLSRGQYWKRDYIHKGITIVYRRNDLGIEETIQLFEREPGNWTWQAARGAGVIDGEAPSIDSAWSMAVDAIRFLEREEFNELLSGSVGG